QEGALQEIPNLSQEDDEVPQTFDELRQYFHDQAERTRQEMNLTTEELERLVAAWRLEDPEEYGLKPGTPDWYRMIAADGVVDFSTLRQEGNLEQLNEDTTEGQQEDEDGRYFVLLDKRCPELWIRAVEIQDAQDLQDINRRYVDGDAPQVDPAHPEHRHIAWFDCVRGDCRNLRHTAYKLLHGAVPFYPVTPITEVHEWGDQEDWDITVEPDPATFLTTINLRIKPTTPNECYDPERALEDCNEDDCRLQLKQKIQAWNVQMEARVQQETRRLREEEEEMRQRRAWRTLGLPHRVVGAYGTLKEMKEKSYRRRISFEAVRQQAEQDRSTMRPEATAPRFESDAIAMQKAYLQRQKEWEQRWSGNDLGGAGDASY
ncbi:hypothetical protein QBC37DRAFT_180937, partial [Rhypophila decipiens]